MNSELLTGKFNLIKKVKFNYYLHFFIKNIFNKLIQEIDGQNYSKYQFLLNLIFIFLKRILIHETICFTKLLLLKSIKFAFARIFMNE